MSSTYKKIGHLLKARQKRLLPLRKQWGIDKLGGKCFNCSTTSNLLIKSKLKGTKTWSSLWGHSDARLEREIIKYMLICSKCHKTLNEKPKIKKPLMSINSGKQTHLTKERQLGIKLGTANHRLRKSVMWKLIQETNRTNCFRCSKPLTLSTFSIDHVVPWRGNDTALFWDINNIEFSHLTCNVNARRTSIYS